MSKRFTFNRTDLRDVFKVILWSGVSAMAATALVLLSEIQAPTEIVWLVPIVNTLLYTIKKFAEERV